MKANNTDELYEIGRRIRVTRLKKGITQIKLAELMEISPQHISKLEKGQSNCSIMMLIKLCEILNVRTDYILRGKDIKNPTSKFDGIQLTNWVLSFYKEISDLSPESQVVIKEFVSMLNQMLNQERK